MLVKSLFCFGLWTSLVKVCQADCHTRASDLNTKWRAVDVMENYGHKYMQHLPVLEEDACDNQKGFVAIFSQALVEYATNNVTDDNTAIRAAAHKTKKLFEKPSYVVASQMRSVISIIFSIIDQPMTDTQVACSYKVRENDCTSTLSVLQENRYRTCPTYSKNIAIFNGFRDLVNSCDFKQFFDSLIFESASADPCEAIDFFIEAAAVKYKSIFQSFKSLFKNMRRPPAPCTAVHFY